MSTDYEMLMPEGGQFFMKDLITGHFRLMAVVFGCIYALVAVLVIIFGAYEGLIFLGVFTAAIAIFIAIFYAAYRAFFKEIVDNMPAIPQLTNPALLQRGQPARAKVLQAHDMGIRINGPNPAVQLVLEVQPPGGEPFQAEATGVIFEGSVPKFQPGNTIYVKYDPKDITRGSIYRSY